jgi:hypothetical protein
MRKNIQKQNNHIFIAKQGGKMQLEKIWNAAAFGLKYS